MGGGHPRYVAEEWLEEEGWVKEVSVMNRKWYDKKGIQIKGKFFPFQFIINKVLKTLK